MSGEAARPVVREMRFTFDLSGPCIYCGKKCTRQRTIFATSTELAHTAADRAVANLCHRKCGGYR